MGNMLLEMGRWEESAENLRKAISISPNFAEAHINLGTTLGKLNRPEEAAISLERAIALQPESVDALCNYSNTLRVLGRLDEAEISAKQALNLKPDNAPSHHSLGNIQMDLNMLEEARASYSRAIAFMPKHAHAHSNLGTALLKLGELNDSVASYQQALTLKPDDAEFMMHLSNALGCIHALDAEAQVLKDLMQLDPDYFGLRAGVNLAIHEFLKGNSEACEKYLTAISSIEAKMSSTFANEKAYRKYLLAILAWRHKNNFRSEHHAADQCLHIIGDSHSLASHNLRVELPGGSFVGNARLIKGCKQWHLGNSANNEFKYQFETIFRSLPKSSEVLLVIGEIDCRIDSGIIKYKQKHPAKVLEDIIQATVSNYVSYVSTVNADYQHSITIQGVPCPNVNMKSSSTQDTELLVKTIRLLNNQLKVESNRAAFGFLDVRELTDSGDGVSSGIWHLDSYHLSPAGVCEAWRKNYTQHHK
jgi:tetratricopeptide (TPR) repeat protein